MTERLVRLGIDYGTSFSKVVFRDYGAPGGEKAYVMLKNHNFRIPSAVGVRDEEFTFGIDPGQRRTHADVVWYESVKMRVAGEIKQDIGRYCYGALPPLPHDFCATDIAVLSVSFLISEAKRAVREHLKTYSGSVTVGFTLGMPMSFFDDSELRNAFLWISKSAWELSKVLDLDQTISFHGARRIWILHMSLSKKVTMCRLRRSRIGLELRPKQLFGGLSCRLRSTQAPMPKLM